ncbi:hypothetical protein [Catellatospora paridis]|uniref:hypothetical protein n=1 Tax=Catellatospora paridis TaxID=1617086 RepID=UPI0012D47FD9|nr:hypothetical protein [Catellatospora paridis]
MSFTGEARLVRDTSRTPAEREAALLRCVRRYAPFGLMGTLGHLDRHADSVDPSTRLTNAVDLLEASRTAWLAELARFAASRKAAKAHGRRRATRAEVEAYATFGWPADESGQAAGRALDPDFLRAYGVALWTPEPVDLRRRLRWAQRALDPPSRFDGCLTSCMVVVIGVLTLASWLLFDPPRAFWYGFVPVAGAFFAYSVVDGFRTAAKEAPRHRRNVEELVGRQEALQARLHRAEGRQ